MNRFDRMTEAEHLDRPGNPNRHLLFRIDRDAYGNPCSDIPDSVFDEVQHVIDTRHTWLTIDDLAIFCRQEIDAFEITECDLVIVCDELWNRGRIAISGNRDGFETNFYARASSQTADWVCPCPRDEPPSPDERG